MSNLPATHASYVKIKLQARELKHSAGISHSQAMEAIVRQHGYGSLAAFQKALKENSNV